MNTVFKKAAIAATISCALTSTAFAGASANLGAMSDYVWRGWTQNASKPSLMGGLDYEASNGFYVGTWAAQVDNSGKGYELDLYGGYSKELSNGLGFDVGAIKYAYPGVSADFTEVYLNGTYKFVEVGVAQTVAADNSASKGDLYTHLTLSKDFGPVSASATFGNTNFNAAGVKSVNHTQLAGTYSIPNKMGDITVAIDDTNEAGSSPIYSLTYSKSFDF